jgi:hypothetical protein
MDLGILVSGVENLGEGEERTDDEAGYQDHKVYFNGCKQEDVHSSNRIGIHGKVPNQYVERSSK